MSEDLYRGARLARLDCRSVDRGDCRFELVWPARGALSSAEASAEPPEAAGPLWVQELAAARYRLVRGFRRFDSLCRAGATSFPALVFAADCRPAALLRARLAGRREELSSVEAARLLARIEPAGLDEADVLELLPLLGQPSTVAAFRALRALGALSEPLARWCALQHTPLAECAALAALPERTQAALLELLQAANPGGNLLRRWLALLAGIALRECCSLEEVLADSRLNEIRHDPQTARSAGRELIGRRLHELRYPESTALRQRFGEAVKALGLPVGMRVEPPEAFEGGTVRVTFEGGSPDELRRLAEALGRAARSPAAGELFRCLGAPDREAS